MNFTHKYDIKLSYQVTMQLWKLKLSTCDFE